MTGNCYDAVVIGGGVLGCFAARNLRRWNISTLLLEQREDVCTGMTRANTAIVYAGYDNKPGSLKAELTVRANAGFDALCRELDVPFSRCGSLMVSFGEKGDRTLEKKYRQGVENGVSGLQLLTGDQARAMEPMLSGQVTSALYCPATGTVNPWQLGIAAYENALDNGCQVRLKTRVTGICRDGEGYRIRTEEETFFSRTVVNCTGADADRIHGLLFPSDIKLELDGADFLVLDSHAAKPGRIIFQETEEGKGITAVPCVEGNLLLDSPPRPVEVPYATTREGMDKIREMALQLFDQADMTRIIRSFGAVRPNPRDGEGRSFPDYCLEQPEPGFLSMIGIKTPGLTCAQELGSYAAQLCARHLGAEKREAFDPVRRGIRPREDREIVCQCGQITRGEILEAIRRGAVTVEGVKRRVGSGMGNCQGSRCSHRIRQLLEEYGHGAL